MYMHTIVLSYRRYFPLLQKEGTMYTHVCVLMYALLMYTCTIESKDSICRDGTDTPTSLKNGTIHKLNAEAISIFRDITCCMSVSIHDKTFKVGKIRHDLR